MDAQPLKVGLLGCGTVGSAVARLILDESEELTSRIGQPLQLVAIAVHDISKPRQGIPADLITDDPFEVVNNPELDIVVELMGGIHPARELIMAAIENKTSVVTANKALLAKHGKELFEAAKGAGVDLYYEAAVAGAIPIVRPLRESLVGDEVKVVMGIVNGTTNYILDKMTTEHMDYSNALSQAQDLGYAEADPTADIQGYDAAAKAALLASLAFHTWVPGDKVYVEGITQIAPQDIRAAQELNCVVKLVAVAHLIDDHKISVRVHPAMVPLDHPLATVNGANNAVFVEARSAGRLMFLGPGAGGAPTSSAVVGDLVTVARHRFAHIVGPSQTMYTGREVVNIGEIRTRYFIRFEVKDDYGVLAEIASVFAAHGISIEAMQQSPDSTPHDHIKTAELHLVTHAARESDLVACIEQLANTASVHGAVRYMRVEGK